MMKFYVKKQNDTTEHEISELVPGVTCLGITHNAPQLTPLVHQIVGSDGELVYGSYFAPSSVDVDFFLQASDTIDYQLMVNDLYRALNSRSLIQIRDDVQPDIVYDVIVKPQNAAAKAAADVFTANSVTVSFINPSGFRRSIVPSDQINEDMAVGMNLPADTPLQYQFNNTNSFNVYNPSDVAIDPYFARHQLMITVTNVQNFGFPMITNTTNSTSIGLVQGNGLQSSDTLVFDGVDVLLNGQPDGANSNMGYLRLEQGNNQIQISGVSGCDVTFSFPFLFL